jgi:large subunit ribosomal protein L28
MARRCDLTGKGVQVGHKVSHSNRKTKKRFLPNLVHVSLTSDTLGRAIRLRLSANGLRTVEHNGGIDAYLMSVSEKDLSPNIRAIRKQIVEKRAAAG